MLKETAQLVNEVEAVETAIENMSSYYKVHSPATIEAAGVLVAIQSYAGMLRTLKTNIKRAEPAYRKNKLTALIDVTVLDRLSLIAKDDDYGIQDSVQTLLHHLSNSKMFRVNRPKY